MSVKEPCFGMPNLVFIFPIQGNDLSDAALVFIFLRRYFCKSFGNLLIGMQIIKIGFGFSEIHSLISLISLISLFASCFSNLL